MRVFLDANILFSASNPKWLSSLLLDVLELHGELVTSEFAAQEARRNVAAFSEDLIDGLEKWFARVHILADTGKASSPLELAEKDRPILDAAISGNCTHLLTGDARHFGMWMGKSVSGVKIVNQRMMTEELRFRSIVD